MANVSIREAVKLYQVSRPTLTKSLKSGKISGVQDSKGQWNISPSELARVYQARSSHPDDNGQVYPVKVTNVNTAFSDEVEILRKRLIEAEHRANVAEALADERSRHIEDLRRMLPTSKIQSSKGLFRRLFG